MPSNSRYDANGRDKQKPMPTGEIDKTIDDLARKPFMSNADDDVRDLRDASKGLKTTRTPKDTNLPVEGLKAALKKKRG